MVQEKKKVLVLGGSIYYEHTYRSLIKKKYYVICFDKDNNAFCKQFANEFYNIDFSNYQKVLDVIKDQNLYSILPLNDYGVVAASYLSKKLFLPGISKEVVSKATNKVFMKKSWKKGGLRTAKFCYSYSRAEIKKYILEIIGFPCILKPASGLGGGSRGVSVIYSSDQVEAALNFTELYYKRPLFIVEEFIQFKTEHSIELLIIDYQPIVILIGDNNKLNPPFRVNESIDYPTSLPAKDKIKIKKIAKRAVMAIGLEFGAAHIEIGICNDKPYLIEMGARAGGGAILSPIVEKITSVDYVDEIVNLFSGGSISNFKIKNKLKINYEFITNQYSMTEINKLKNNLINDPNILGFYIDNNYSNNKKIKTGLDRQGYIIREIK